MAARPLMLAALILAAGSGKRFDPLQPAAKLLAELEGQPLLEHVLRAVRDFEPETTVVVLGDGAAEIEQAIDWAPTEIRAVNPHPDRGLASSLQTGIWTLEAMRTSLDGVFIILGDQPRLRAETMIALRDAAARARPADRPLVVPRYSAEEEAGARNPVLLLRPVWPLVKELAGDRGLASIAEERPDMVHSVPVAGSMPDVDTAADLKRLRRAPA
jgi:CTP:molybdopterin cytidylyltransferase MocA